MNKPYCKLVLILSLLCFSFLVSAKELDTRLRTGLKLKTDFSDKFEGSFETQYRIKNNLATFDKFLVEPSVYYNLNSKLRLGLTYRFIADQNNKYQIKYRHRANVSLRYKRKLFQDISIKARSSLQYGFDDFSSSFLNYDQKLISRNLIEAEYNIFGSALSPFINYEIFYNINHENGGMIDQWRIATGINYELSKRSKVTASYTFNKEKINTNTDSQFITIIYSYKI